VNYLAHAYQHLHDPYFAAGTALPDWMSIIDRKNRARRQFAEPIAEHPNPFIASFARGCIQHHDDDRWFHQTEVFVMLSTAFAVELRDLLDPGLGHQAGFVGHITVELLLDSAIGEREPQALDDYYRTLQSLNAELVEQAANEICKSPVTRLARLLPRFVDARFLADYQDDELLRGRLNGVMQRIGLPQLPPPVTGWLASARLSVRQSADALLTPPVTK
jgi:hypothetical protein